MISAIMKKMIAFSKGSLHDIDHFIKVWSYARTIAELENVKEEDRRILEIAAIVHDIACPSLRERYGFSDGKKQEVEGPPMAKKLLSEFNLSEKQLERVLYLVGHHHTYEGVDGVDYQILLEADYIVNAGESAYSRDNILSAKAHIFKTSAGKEILESIYGV